MMKLNIFFLIAVIFNTAVNFSQEVVLNNFEDEEGTSKIVTRNGAQFSIIENVSLINEDPTFNNFEPGSSNVVARFGAEFSVVPNPQKNEVNDTENSLRVGRTTANWFELVAFPVTPYKIPANTTKYLHISVNYPSEPDIAIRIDAEDENSSGSTNVAIRPLNKYDYP